MRVKTALTRRLPLLVYGAGSPLVEVRGDFLSSPWDLYHYY